MTDDLGPVNKELRRAYSEIAGCFTNPLPMPVINTPNKDRRRKGWSWYTPDSWESQGTDILNAFAAQEEGVGIQSKSEICFAAEGLALPKKQILMEIAHQVVHHYNYVYKQKDTACGLNYDGKPIDEPRSIEGYAHNYYFTNTANMIGLKWPSKDDDGQWSFGLQDPIKTVIENFVLDESIFDLNRREVMLSKKTRTGMRLYECAHGQKIRAATYTLNAVCKECNYPFIYADTDAEIEQVKHLQTLRQEYRQ